ncbi:SDR family NAD(P)-dependent oxidoreductase [Actinomadura monticuli]|uniref:SDR family NAD(P)-dependent oxidoreductase n=1 Tax=Actinomadura monticuli TaxID=3097367 RepID=A0ABV4QBU6_9ACTN
MGLGADETSDRRERRRRDHGRQRRHRPGRRRRVRATRRGAKIALLARGETGLRGAAADVEAAGGQALPIGVDMADGARVEEAARRAEDELGPIDVWVNVAFSSVLAPFWEIGFKDPQKIGIAARGFRQKLTDMYENMPGRKHD